MVGGTELRQTNSGRGRVVGPTRKRLCALVEWNDEVLKTKDTEMSSRVSTGGYPTLGKSSVQNEPGFTRIL